MRKKTIRWLAVILGTPLLVLAALLLVYLGANRTNGEIESSGRTRRYLLYVPESYRPERATSLVISLHGLADWPARHSSMTGWNALAEAEGFIVVYPAGTGFPRRWESLGGAGESSGAGGDVAFISDLIDALSREYNIDPDHIYVNGLSNGGGMSHLLACVLSDRIAAIGTVAGAYGLPDAECRPSRPVPVIAFHGTADPIVPYEGVQLQRPSRVLRPAAEWAAGWAARNGCDATPAGLPPVGAVSGVRYGDCDREAEVLFYTVEGGGHTWPGGEPIPAFIAGETNQDIDATRLMWDFFQAHPLSR